MQRATPYPFVLAAALLAPSCSGPAVKPAGEGTSIDPARTVKSADHHLHIQSPASAQLIDRLNVVFEEGDPGKPTPARDASEAIAALDRAQLEGGVVLSNAYMFAGPDLEVEDEATKVREENDFLSREVSRYPERLVGLCSVNPLRHYALDEVERCSALPGIVGLKLHLANSDVDLRNDEHTSALAELFVALEQHSMAALVHLRTRNPDYGETDAQHFLEQVLAAAPEVPVQIAHMAGWGGYDDATDSALGAFAEAIRSGVAGADHLIFGLGAVVFQPAAAGDDEALAQRVRGANQKLAGRIREIGIERVVYATDWPSWPPVSDASTGIRRNVELIRAELPLLEHELEQIFRNVGPFFAAASDL